MPLLVAISERESAATCRTATALKETPSRSSKHLAACPANRRLPSTFGTHFETERRSKDQKSLCPSGCCSLAQLPLALLALLPLPGAPLKGKREAKAFEFSFLEPRQAMPSQGPEYRRSSWSFRAMGLALVGHCACMWPQEFCAGLDGRVLGSSIQGSVGFQEREKGSVRVVCMSPVASKARRLQASVLEGSPARHCKASLMHGVYTGSPRVKDSDFAFASFRLFPKCSAFTFFCARFIGSLLFAFCVGFVFACFSLGLFCCFLLCFLLDPFCFVPCLSAFCCYASCFYAFFFVFCRCFWGGASGSKRSFANWWVGGLACCQLTTPGAWGRYQGGLLLSKSSNPWKKQSREEMY